MFNKCEEFKIGVNVAIAILGFLCFAACWDLYRNDVANFLLGASMVGCLNIFMYLADLSR